MYTSFLTLGVMLAPMFAIPERPTWQPSYTIALDRGQKESKPVAVFVGSGPQGQAAAVKGGHFSADQLRILAQKYVCVYLDRTQAGNQRLVRDLGITVAGLVVSDKSGNFQAFHHDGVIAQDALSKELQNLADPNRVVSRTVSNTPARVSYYGGPVESSSGVSRGRTVSC